jgi:hypothetical protein
MIDLKKKRYFIGLIGGIGLFNKTFLKKNQIFFLIIVHADGLHVVYS